MRPLARQSTVHVMHHLTRKAEGLCKKKGPDDKKAANQKRAERIMQEALIIKVLVSYISVHNITISQVL